MYNANNICGILIRTGFPVPGILQELQEVVMGGLHLPDTLFQEPHHHDAKH